MPVGARKPGPGRQIVSQDSASGVSRLGGQAGTQAPDPTRPSARSGKPGRKHYHTLPADSAAPVRPAGVRPPSLPATRTAAILALQTLHDYSDRETAEAVRFDVRWKVACGLAIDDVGVDPSSLVYWRRRIAKSERPHRVSDAVKKVAGETGVLRGGGAGRWTPRSLPMPSPPRTR